jgi:uncharacterized protein YjbI with pentapeptide repeats
MTRTNGRRQAPEPGFRLPDLAGFDGDRLDRGGDYDAIAFVGLDLAGQDASDARFMECRLERCSIDGMSLQRARFIGTLLADNHGASVDLAESTWRESRITGGRIGSVILTGATWNGIRARGARLGFVNLAGARLEEVVLEQCRIDTLDLRLAHLRSVTFIDCTIEALNVAGASLSNVDLTGAALRSLVGVESLGGAIVSREQLSDLAPVLAEQLGIEVRGD